MIIARRNMDKLVHKSNTLYNNTFIEGDALTKVVCLFQLTQVIFIVITETQHWQQTRNICSMQNAKCKMQNAKM